MHTKKQGHVGVVPPWLPECAASSKAMPARQKSFSLTQAGTCSRGSAQTGPTCAFGLRGCKLLF